MRRLLDRQTFIVALVGAISLFFNGYYVTRNDEFSLLIVYIILTGLFLYAFPFWKSVVKLKFEFKQVLFIAVIFRLVLLFSTPNLSDDYYRFIWDGDLISKGYNPYEHKPIDQQFESVIEKSRLECRTFNGNETFPEGMNSKKYYSVYPPVNQAIFGLASFFAGDNSWLNIVFLRLFIIGFDIGVIIILSKLLLWFGKRKELIVIYALNPLVITELTGNLHFEGVTLFFILAAFWFLLVKRELQAGLLYAFAICTKLIPILFLPLFIFRMKWKKLFIFYSVIGFVTFLLFLPFTDVNLLETFGSSVGLYFKSFEFNASLYYIFRGIGFLVSGYNEIELIGQIGQGLVLLATIIILIKSRKETELKNVIKYFVWLLLIYYSVASVVHPWYVIYVLTFSIFTDLRFPLIWSFAVVLSYFAYRDVSVVNESYWLIGFEYLILLIAIVWDLRNIQKRTSLRMSATNEAISAS
tara:strand:- start:515 stop:1918 length:1404 start_codon:yes stop_codon:yes gene_type:complete